ncbi:MAG: YndJ family transporter [Candidatus Limnocylindria bacterium]
MDALTVRTLIVALFLVGPLVVVPLGLRLVPTQGSATAARLLRIARWTALPAGVALAVAFVLEPGAIAALLTVPWLATAVLAGLVALLDGRAAIDRGRFLRPGPHHAIWAALLFLGVAAGHATADRLSLQPFGFAPLIVLLTAVHFTFAGFGLVLVGALVAETRPARWLELALGSLVVGMPVTALGFFGVRPAVLAGAWLVAAGGLGIGLELVRSTGVAGVARALRVMAGLALLVAMPLAALYAAGDVLGLAWLDIPVMARTHGALNVLGFAVPAVVALTLERRGASVRPDGPARAIDVLGFNATPFILAPAAGVLALIVSLASLPLLARIPLAIAGVAAIVMTVAAIATIWWVFERSADRRWAWVTGQAGRPRRWLNLTAGFDDSSAMLRRSLGGEGRSIDVLDPTQGLERPLARARRRFPPPGPSVAPAAVDAAVDPGGADVVFLLMSAHEAHGNARTDLLRSAARALAPGGRIILVEHLRDAANVLAFGPGAWHFSSRDEWMATTRVAGLRLVDEARLGPFVAGFALARAAEARAAEG